MMVDSRQITKEMLMSDRQMGVRGEKTQSPNGSKPEEFDVVILGGGT